MEKSHSYYDVIISVAVHNYTYILGTGPMPDSYSHSKEKLHTIGPISSMYYTTYTRMCVSLVPCPRTKHWANARGGISDHMVTPCIDLVL